MKTTATFSILILGSLGFSLGGCSLNSGGYAPDFHGAQLQNRASQIGETEKAAFWPVDRPVLVNNDGQTNSIGVESNGDRVLLRHNGGEFVRNGVVVANFADLGSPDRAMRVVEVPPVAGPLKELTAVSALPEDPETP